MLLTSRRSRSYLEMAKKESKKVEDVIRIRNCEQKLCNGTWGNSVDCPVTDRMRISYLNLGRVSGYLLPELLPSVTMKGWSLRSKETIFITCAPSPKKTLSFIALKCIFVNRYFYHGHMSPGQDDLPSLISATPYWTIMRLCGLMILCIERWLPHNRPMYVTPLGPESAGPSSINIVRLMKVLIMH